MLHVASWLAGLSDGPAVLAAGGAVRLWDPVTRAPLAELFRRFGQPVVSMDPPVRRGTDGPRHRTS
jgi:hypothetical protein